MEGFLVLGFLVGMQHALEADHLAAIGTMIEDGPRSKSSLVLRGAVWGLGHTITLFAICSAVILTGLQLTDRLSSALEFCVGFMLLVLGADVWRRMWKRRIHFHVHTHDDQKTHIHVHSHEHSVSGHNNDPHRHEHAAGFPIKALIIGLIHGSAGSAGLLVLAIAATQQPMMAIGYVLVFGVGALVGMAALTLVIAWPLGVVERSAAWIYKGATFAAGAVAIGVAIQVMLDNAGVIGSSSGAY